MPLNSGPANATITDQRTPYHLLGDYMESGPERLSTLKSENVYMTDNILQIDPATGEVKAVANLANILASVGIKEDPKLKDSGNVLNGIAYHKQRGTFFITGKYWPVIIELKFNYEK
jgi:glutamine cyclotransferase